MPIKHCFFLFDTRDSLVFSSDSEQNWIIENK